MKKGRLKEIVKELQGASKMHLKQSKEIASHIDDMESPAKQFKIGQNLQIKLTPVQSRMHRRRGKVTRKCK